MEAAEHTQRNLCGWQPHEPALPTSRPALATMTQPRFWLPSGHLFAFISSPPTQGKTCIVSEAERELLCHCSAVVSSGKGLSSFQSLFLSGPTCGGTWGSLKGANCSCTIKSRGVSRPPRSPGQLSPKEETVALLIRALTFTWLLFNTHSTLPQTPIQNIDISADRLGQILE